MRKQVDRSAVIRRFEEIREAFPQLSMRLNHDPSRVDLNMDIPQQPGLTFDMNLNLQGDELQLNAGAFWLEWFPCTRQMFCGFAPKGPDRSAVIETATDSTLAPRR